MNSVIANWCVEGPDGQRACYSVGRGALVNSVFAIQCVQGLWLRACLLFSLQRGSDEQRACYSVCPGALVENVLAVQLAEGLW